MPFSLTASLWVLPKPSVRKKGESITDVEVQSGRYANSIFKWIKNDYKIRFAYETTDKLIRFTDYNDIKYRSRTVFSFHRPETLLALLGQSDTIRNNMKHFPALDETGFRKCQVNAIKIWTSLFC